MEKTLVLIKPDAFAKHYSGDILKRYEQEGFRVVAMKLLKMDERLASIHYAEHIGRPYYRDLVGFMTSAPLIAMVLAVSVRSTEKPIRLRQRKERFAGSLLPVAAAMRSTHRTVRKVQSGKFPFSLMKRKSSMKIIM